MQERRPRKPSKTRHDVTENEARGRSLDTWASDPSNAETHQQGISQHSRHRFGIICIASYHVCHGSFPFISPWPVKYAPIHESINQHPVAYNNPEIGYICVLQCIDSHLDPEILEHGHPCTRVKYDLVRSSMVLIIDSDIPPVPLCCGNNKVVTKLLC